MRRSGSRKTLAGAACKLKAEVAWPHRSTRRPHRLGGPALMRCHASAIALLVSPVFFTFKQGRRDTSAAWKFGAVRLEQGREHPARVRAPPPKVAAILLPEKHTSPDQSPRHPSGRVLAGPLHRRLLIRQLSGQTPSTPRGERLLGGCSGGQIDALDPAGWLFDTAPLCPLEVTGFWHAEPWLAAGSAAQAEAPA